MRARLASALVVLAAALAGCASGDPPASDGAGDGGRFHPVSSFGDVHGLAVDPERASVLYVATHRGLVRAVDDANWSRVGDAADDLMGFSAHPKASGTFWASGHPATGGNLGVRKSVDGGLTWRLVGFEGVDFHAMTVSAANPDHLWGYSVGKVFRSVDGGVTWRVAAERAPRALSLAADPWNSETVYAAGPDGVWRSTDGGATWSAITRDPAVAVAVNPRDARELLWAALPPEDLGSDRTTWAPLWRSREGDEPGTRTNERLPLMGVGGLLSQIAYAPSEPRTIYAATYEGAVFKSIDAGAVWSEVRAAER